MTDATKSLGHDADLLTAADAARLLGVTPRTVYKWARRGRLARVKLSGPRGAVRFRHSDIAAFIAACTLRERSGATPAP